MHTSSRREFLKSTVTTAGTAGLSACGLGEFFAASPASGGILKTPPPALLPIKKGVLLDMLPAKLSDADRFKMVRDVGLAGNMSRSTPFLIGRSAGGGVFR